MWHEDSLTNSSIADSFFRICRVKPTTARSAWNCANDDSSDLRARSLPNWAIKFIDMLYDGENEERNG